MMAYTSKTPYEKLFELAWHMDRLGNQGWYQSQCLIKLYRYGRLVSEIMAVDVNSIPKDMRDGILYYSSGHGWRVRKKPHWCQVFRERFPGTWHNWKGGAHGTS